MRNALVSWVCRDASHAPQRAAARTRVCAQVEGRAQSKRLPSFFPILPCVCTEYNAFARRDTNDFRVDCFEPRPESTGTLMHLAATQISQIRRKLPRHCLPLASRAEGRLSRKGDSWSMSRDASVTGISP
jgi:hypothetical protein